MKRIPPLLRAVRANLREAVAAFFRSERWVHVFLALGTLAMAGCLLIPGSTIESYHAYALLRDTPDNLLALPLLAVGLWGLAARSTGNLAAVALATGAVYLYLALSITFGVYHHVAVTPGAGPSLAPVHYWGWTALSLLLAARAWSRFRDEHDRRSAEAPAPRPPDA